MITKKQIDEAAKKHSANASGDYIAATEAEKGFKEGAHWAIQEFLKGLWHPASEEPKGYNEWILLYYSTGNFLSVHQVKDFVNWKKFVEFAPFKQWAYLDDLFE